MAELLRSLRTFSEKCGIADGALGSTAIEMTNGGSRSVAIARVAVWTAIRDVWDVNGYLTPGQVSAIVDASPILLGANGLKEVGACKSISKLDAFVRANAPKWGACATAVSQLWSLNHLAGENAEQTRAVTFTDSDISRLAIASALVKAGQHRRANPEALLHALEPKTGIPAKLLKQAAAGRVSSSPKTANDKAATVMHLARQGNFEALANSGIMGIFADAAVAAAENEDAPVQQLRKAGAFLGPRNLDEIRRLGETPKSGEPLAEYFAKTPAGNYPATILQSFPLNGNEISSDMAIAAMHGLSRAWANYCPIVPQKEQSGAKNCVRLECSDIAPLIETHVRTFASKAFKLGRPEEIAPGHLAAAPAMEVPDPVEGETLNLGKTSFKVVDQSLAVGEESESMAHRMGQIHETLASRNPALARRFADLPSGKCSPDEVAEMKGVLVTMAEEQEIPYHLGSLLDSAHRLVESTPAPALKLPSAPAGNFGDRMVKRLAALVTRR